MRRFNLLWIIGLWLMMQGWALQAQDFLSPEQAFLLSVDTSSLQEVRLTWQIHKGYYLYRDHMVIQGTPANSVTSVDLPPGTVKHDANVGDTAVYHDAITVRVATAGATQLDVQWQGCAEAGVCYPPQHQTVALPNASARDGEPRAPSTGILNQEANTSEHHFSGVLEGSNWAGVMAVFFGMGILLAFTPCVLPMVPILSSLVVAGNASTRRAFALSLAFVLAMALTYAVLGVAAALAGANLQAFLQNRWTILGFGMVFAVLALAMFGAFEMQFPAGLRQWLTSTHRRQRGGTLMGAAAMGVSSALFVGPCMTAPLAGALLYIAQSGNAVRGGSALFALGLGMGVPLLLVCTAGSHFLPKPGLWMQRIKVFFGFLLLTTAVWMVQRVVSTPLAMALWGCLLLAIACALFFGLAHQASVMLNRIVARYLGLLLGLWAGIMLVGSAIGASDPWQPLVSSSRPTASSTQASYSTFTTVRDSRQFEQQLALAKQSGRPVLIDFSAEWCVSCQVIDKAVFGDPKAQQVLSGMWLLRVDVTDNSPDQQALMHTYQVMGPPTVMLLDNTGKEHRDLRFVGEFDTDEFLKHVAQLRVNSDV